MSATVREEQRELFEISHLQSPLRYGRYGALGVLEPPHAPRAQ